FMTRIHSLKYFAAGVLLPLSFLYWPVACATSATQGASATQSATVSGGPALGTPAFAKAEPPLEGTSVADVAERVTPSVVSISISSERAAAPQLPFGFPFPFGAPPSGPQKQKGLGSGVIVSA